MRFWRRLWRWFNPPVQDIEIQLGLKYMLCSRCRAHTRASDMLIGDKGKLLCRRCGGKK
jgi:hypothetical protein